MEEEQSLTWETAFPTPRSKNELLDCPQTQDWGSSQPDHTLAKPLNHANLFFSASILSLFKLKAHVSAQKTDSLDPSPASVPDVHTDYTFLYFSCYPAPWLTDWSIGTGGQDSADGGQTCCVCSQTLPIGKTKLGWHFGKTFLDDLKEHSEFKI